MTETDLLTLREVRSLCRSGLARAIREAASLSTDEVAAAVGVTHPTVSRWERGVRSPHGAAALRYAGLLRALREQQR